MASKKKVNAFVKSQQSIQFYPKVQKALTDVLSAMSEKDFNIVTNNLILMVLHESALGQVMHFPKSNKFKILQLSVAKKIPLKVLRYLIAHELGHAMQGRNWRKSDGMKLEEDAENWTRKWGFRNTPSIAAWCKKFDNQF